MLDLVSGSSVESGPTVDSGSLEGSIIDSRPGFEVERGSRLGFVTSSGSVVDSESATGLDFVTAECFPVCHFEINCGQFSTL